MESSPAAEAPETSQTQSGQDARPRDYMSCASPAISFQTYALAGIASHVSNNSLLAEKSLEIQFLLEHLRAVDPEGKGWATGFPDYLREPDSRDALLFYCARELGLTVIETLAVALAASIEEDVMIGRVLAYLQSPLGNSRPTLGLIATSFIGLVAAGVSPINLLLNGNALRSGLLTLPADGLPLPERSVSVPLHLCLSLSGHDGSLAGTCIGIGNSPEVALPLSIAEEARNHASGLQSSAYQRVLVLRTGSTAEGKSVAAAIAYSLKRRPLFIETDRISSLDPWLILRHLLPVFSLDLAPGERKVLPPLPFYRGPILVLCGPDGSIETSNGASLNWTLPVPSMEEREELWRMSLGDGDLAFELASQHRHSSGRIAHLGRLAHQRSLLNGRSQPTREDIAKVSWIGEGTGLDALAQPLTDEISDDALVMTPSLRNELNVLLMRCRARDTLVRGLGASATTRYHPGVRALFVGPSGTGRTLAAVWLATKLGIPLYRVDLASVTSKYIGETEKNLAQLLARAERAEVVLLFDEADSLFGKRTEVKEANDRFANAQTNYLLQRIEYFDGIVFLTSNSRARFDSAFSRRLDMVVEFPAPGPEERRALWQSHLGLNHCLAQKELNQLAAGADLCGGNIRNIVLTAAVLAHEKNCPIEYGDVLEGLIGEYRKLGRQMPVELKRV